MGNAYYWTRFLGVVKNMKEVLEFDEQTDSTEPGRQTGYADVEDSTPYRTALLKGLDRDHVVGKEGMI